ncbi:G-protein alpha subunit [Mycena sanguinolenta]|nr:G-protein alpha subunit [Mycena sanguinolenta]
MRRASKARSDKIDRQLEEDSKHYRKKVKVLLLGSDESDRSTIVKQMKIHHGGFSPAELLAFRSTIHTDVVNSAQAVVRQLKACGLEELLSESHRHLPAGILGDETLTQEMAGTIDVLWRDPVFVQMFNEHQSEIHWGDSAAYFINNIQRLAQSGYTPTEEDVLHASPQRTSITETCLNVGGLSVYMYDIGIQCSERKEWIHHFESVTSIIFCTALINSRWFLRTSIILFLCKIDVFRVKIQEAPLERYFPEYIGGADINKAAKYILWRFMQENRSRLNIYPHITEATDTKNVRLVFAAIKETILQNALKDSGIL